MTCPRCKAKLETYDSREIEPGRVKRYRRCPVCGFHASSIEYLDGFEPLILSEVQRIKMSAVVAQLASFFAKPATAQPLKAKTDALK